MSEEVEEAVHDLVTAFGDGRLDDYFACFAPDATFVFHTTPGRLGSTDEYRDLWARWVADDGFRVRSCRTTDTNVQDLGDVAIVTHSVETEIETNDGSATEFERETIVFARQADGRWLAVHEHLSPMPEGA